MIIGFYGFGTAFLRHKPLKIEVGNTLKRVLSH